MENRNKRGNNSGTDTLQFQESRILRWMDDIDLQETEEIFDFLTQEKEKFLSTHNITTNHANDAPAGDKTLTTTTTNIGLSINSTEQSP